MSAFTTWYGTRDDLLRDLAVLPAHEALDRENRVFGVGDRLPLGDLADQPLAVLREADDGRRGAPAFLVDDDRGLPAFHDRDDRVGGAEVDSNHFAHGLLTAPKRHSSNI